MPHTTSPPRLPHQGRFAKMRHSLLPFETPKPTWPARGNPKRVASCARRMSHGTCRVLRVPLAEQHRFECELEASPAPWRSSPSLECVGQLSAPPPIPPPTPTQQSVVRWDRRNRNRMRICASNAGTANRQGTQEELRPVTPCPHQRELVAYRYCSRLPVSGYQDRDRECE